MAFFVGRDREARRAYGFDEIASGPGRRDGQSGRSRHHDVNIGPLKLEIPFLASAMDGVVDAQVCHRDGQAGRPGGPESGRHPFAL